MSKEVLEPTPGQPTGSDEGPTAGSEAEQEPRGSRWGGSRAVLISVGVIVGLLVLVKLTGGSPTGILNNMLREAISPKTAAVAIAVIGMNLHFGFTGLLNFGQSGFMLLGAYGFAISISHYHWPLPVAILVGLLTGGLFALLMGVPTLKLRGDYLAMATISAAEIIRYTGGLAKLENFTGAAQGIPGSRYITPFRNLSFLPDDGSYFDPFHAVGLGRLGLAMEYQWTGVDGWWVRLVAWVLVLLCTGAVFLLVRSPWGRLLRGIREDEDAMRSLGKNVFALKMQSLVIGGLLGSLGGMVYVLTGSVQPDSMGRSLTFFAWTALLLGGAATIFGPILGTVLFFTLRQFVQGTAGSLVPDSIMNTQQSQQFSWIVVGIALMLLVIFRPQGILGDKRELRFNV
jgi:branched-chain amino acid transport system permease protein